MIDSLYQRFNATRLEAFLGNLHADWGDELALDPLHRH
jgi:hypothetical protein